MNPLLLLPPGIVRNRLWLRAGAVPSFHIAPARTRSAADLITGSVLGTYNSATPAMAVGPDGLLFQPAANAPVIEYDPTTLSCLGARIWGVVTNQLLRSQEFETASWAKARASITANVIVAPDNTTTAEKLTEDTTASNSHTTSQTSVSFTSGSLYTFSVFVKAAERTRVRMQVPSAAFGTNVSYNFDLTAVTATVSTSGTSDLGLILPMRNGWYRCSLTAQATATSTGTVTILLVNDTGSASYTGDGTSGIYLWGAQLNPGGLAPYVPTTTTSASSTADVWSITGADAARILNQGQGTIFVSVPVAFLPAGTVSLFSIDDTTSSQRILGQINGADTVVNRVIDGGVDQMTLSRLFSGQSFANAVAYAANDFAITANGLDPVSDTSGTVPAVSRIVIGNNVSSSNALNGYIRELAIFRSRRPNSNLQAMTS